MTELSEPMQTATVIRCSAAFEWHGRGAREEQREADTTQQGAR